MIMKKFLITVVIVVLVVILSTSCKKLGICNCYYPEGYNGPYIDWNPYDRTEKECKEMSKTLGFECEFVIGK